jgi:CO/xanthine dehydrogenase Mo-binding subunit
VLLYHDQVTLDAGSFEPLDLPAIALRSTRTGGPISAEVQINAQGQAPGFTTHICDVEVDPETGHVKILRYTAIQDVGRAIQRALARSWTEEGWSGGL